MIDPPTFVLAFTAMDAVAASLRVAARECQERGLFLSAKWATEQLVSIPAASRQPMAVGRAAAPAVDALAVAEADDVAFAQALFQCKEYQRCADSLRACRGNLAVFVRFYSMYLASEKRREEALSDFQSQEPVANPALVQLLQELEPFCRDPAADAYLLYLQAVLLRKLKRSRDAINQLLRSVAMQPYHWGAWLELINACTSLEHFKDIVTRLPQNDFMVGIFKAQALLDLHYGEEAEKILATPVLQTIPKSPHVLGMRGFCFYVQQKMDSAVTLFEQLFTEHPLRLEHSDVYSNVLYILDQTARMANLAQMVMDVDRYRPESCCVVANYYSKKHMHEKALTYFGRALKLSPSFAPAWTLMGHEYLELKNIHAAIACYRRAVDINQHDYRAWYSLGQAYEVLKLPLYSLYYYRKAATLRPYDPRMWQALGSTYESLDRLVDAAHCYERGKDEAAIFALARLYRKLNDALKAAAYFEEYMALQEGTMMNANQSEACLFLGQHYARRNNLDQAQKWLSRATEWPGMDAETAKAELRSLEISRAMASVRPRKLAS